MNQVHATCMPVRDTLEVLNVPFVSSLHNALYNLISLSGYFALLMSICNVLIE